jgi:hypothetical protein
MSPSSLILCPACNRHVRAAETHCPFCDAAQPDRTVAPDPRLPRKRLGRAALMTAGAALLGAAEACGDSLPSNDASTNNDAASDTSTQDGGPVALYGAPAPEYGVPPPPTESNAAQSRVGATDGKPANT